MLSDKITINYHSFIADSKPGDSGCIHAYLKNQLHNLHCQSNGLHYAGLLWEHLKNRGLCFVVWNGEKITSNGVSLMTHKESCALYDWSNVSLETLKAQLNGDVDAYYKAFSANQTMSFFKPDFISPNQFSLEVARRFTQQLIEYFAATNHHRIVNFESFVGSVSDEFLDPIMRPLIKHNDIQPRDLIELIDVDAIWQSLSEKCDIEQLNNVYLNKAGSSISESFVLKKDYKHHSVLKLSFDSLNNLSCILGHLGMDDSYFERMGSVKSKWGSDLEKIKIHKPILKKLTIFLNHYAKDALSKAVERKQAGYI